MEACKSIMTTPKKMSNPPHSLSASLLPPMVATPEPRQTRIVKSCIAASDTGSDLPHLSSRISGLPHHPLQKYEMLSELFNAVVRSIRLLWLKRLPATLTRLSRCIESLTESRLTLHHLAQLKYIMPEVIVVRKIRIQDRESCCMKEELLVSLEVDEETNDENRKGSGVCSQLKGIFQSRLNEYSRSHDVGDEVPEAELPQLFYQPRQEPEPRMCISPIPQAELHIAPSFKRRFSSRALSVPISEYSQAESSSHSLETPMKEAIPSDAKDESSIASVKVEAAPFGLVSVPDKLISTPSKLVSTPVKLTSTPARLMTATPVLLPPKRPLITPDHDYSDDVPNKSAKRRALKFEQSSYDIDDQPSHIGKEEVSFQAEASNYSKGVLRVLPDDQSLIEKEQKNLEDQNPIISREKRRRQLMAGVPKLFDMILLLFQSIRRPVVTKEELIFKLVSGHLDIIDRREVEEQLELLQKIAPECISELQSLSGDTLICFNKTSCPESMRTKLLEAI